MHCGYRIPEPWILAEDRRRYSLALVDTVTNKELAKLQVARRHSPILLGRPRRVSWRASVEMPRRWLGQGWNQVLAETGMRFTSNLDVSKRTVVLNRQLTLDTWSIPADQADAYLRVVAKANLNLTKLFARARLGRIVPATSTLRWVLASRWRRALLALCLFILFEIVMSMINGARAGRLS